jgi:long-chain acyl-CoA synthetase
MNSCIELIFPNLVSNIAHIAIHEKGCDISYSELGRTIDNLSANILKSGVMQKSRIGLCFDNTASFVCGYMSILGANCIPVLLSPGLTAEKITYILEDSGAVGILGEAKSFCKISSFPRCMLFAFVDGIGDYLNTCPITIYSFKEGINSREMFIDNYSEKVWESETQSSYINKIATIIYTSGTTGKPKGVMLTETNLLVATSAIIKHLALTSLDTCLVTMSFAHCAGLLHLLAHLRVGAKVVTGENPTLIGPLLAAIKKQHVTILPGVPSFYTLLLKHPKHKVGPYLENIRAVESSSAMINGALAEKIIDLFPSATLYNTYGLTEAPRATYIVVDPSSSDTMLSVGHPTDGVKIKVVDQELRLCQPNEEGEIIISGPNLALGYWNNQEKTAAAFCSSGFKTGDIGHIDEKGLLLLKGRKDEMIKIGAEAVYPYEVEEIISLYPGIEDVLAYGVEDEILGCTINIKVVCKDRSIDENVILSYCKDKLEKHKIPSKIIFCDTIDLEESGKPKRGNRPL